MMMISMKKGLWILSLICLKICSIGLVMITAIPIDCQQALAKFHLKKRWATDSSLCRMHNSHEYESSSIFLLLSNSLVLTRSFNSSQKKTLCFIWHLDFQIQRKVGCAFLLPINALYILAFEKVLFPPCRIHLSCPCCGCTSCSHACKAPNCWNAWVESGRWNSWVVLPALKSEDFLDCDAFIYCK